MRQGINRKSAVLPLSAISTIPRVRTYHTKEPSRFVHALSARPLKVRELTDLRSKRGRRRRDGVYQKSSKDFPSLENLPASSRFALCKQSSPSGANIASEPSHYSLTMATGSKRSSADSDSLLCHVMLRRTSRVEVMAKIWVRTWQDKVYYCSPVSALTLTTPALHFQRACTHCLHARI